MYGSVGTDLAAVDVFKLDLTFPNGFKSTGEGASVEDPAYTMNIRAMLGIDIFNFCDMAIIAKGKKQGIALYRK